MRYEVIYDIQQVSYPAWWVFAAGLFFVCFGATLFLLRKNQTLNSIFDMSTRFKRDVMPLLAVAFGLLWIMGGALNYSHFASLRTLARNENVDIVEGKVTDFVPMPYEGHADETFVVGGHHFAYSDYDQTKGFNHTRSHGGPMNEGRITYVDDSILKLEIAR
jgi:hypothetical protein